MTKYTVKHFTDIERCEAIDKYYFRKEKEHNEVKEVLQDIKETTSSNGDSEKTPAISVTKTSKQYLKDSLPSVVDFAVEVGVSKQTIYNWYDEGMKKDATDERAYFSKKLDSLRSLGEKSIIDARNNGYIDPVFAKFLLSAWYNYREKSDVTSDDKPLDTIMKINYISPDGDKPQTND